MKYVGLFLKQKLKLMSLHFLLVIVVLLTQSSNGPAAFKQPQWVQVPSFSGEHILTIACSRFGEMSEIVNTLMSLTTIYFVMA